MKVNQVVYVVVDKNDENLIGTYNEYEDALKTLEDYNASTVSITPVLVDAAPDYGRRLIYDDELMDAYTKSEMFLAENSEEEEEEEEKYYSLTPKGEFFLKLLDSGINHDEALKIANIIFDEKEDGE